MSTLYWSQYSPYVRKVVLALRELGIEGVVNKPIASLPIMTTIEQDAWNPAGKVPTLVLPDGRGIFGSQVCLQYLDSISETKKILPSGASRIDELVLEALADTVLDAAVLIRYETTLRPEELRWEAWITGQKSKILRAMTKISERVPGAANDLYKLPNPAVEVLPVGGIAAACACFYLDLRYPEIDWRKGDGGAALGVWYSKIQTRASWKNGEN